MIINKPIKPKKPYKNFDEYLNLHRFRDGDRELRCFKCNGAGRIYDPNDPPCPIEGNKMRDRIKCPLCGGSKVGTSDTYKLQYKEVMERYRIEMDSYKERMKMHDAICKKLSKEEREYIGI